MVEKLLEETQEAREYQREIGEMLSNNLTLDEEDAVQAELRQMQADIEAEPQEAISLPTVPTTPPEKLSAVPQVEEGQARVPVPA